MLRDLLPFPFILDTAAISGGTLWALALYLGFSPVSRWVTEQLNRWFNFAERFLYISEAEFERTRAGRESQNAFLASLMSIVPFLVAGGLLYWGVALGLGGSWAMSLGLIACVGCGVYELGRRQGHASE